MVVAIGLYLNVMICFNSYNINCIPFLIEQKIFVVEQKINCVENVMIFEVQTNITTTCQRVSNLTKEKILKNYEFWQKPIIIWEWGRQSRRLENYKLNLFL